MRKQDNFRTRKNIWPLAICQFLSSFNEESMRMFVALFLMGSSQGKNICRISSLSYIAYSLPYFLLFGTAGAVADRFNRVNIFIFSKYIALLASILITGSFYLNRSQFSLLSLSLFSSHIVILNPAKYSLIPDLVPNKHITKVNSFFWIVSVIAGMVGQPFAAFLIQATNKSFVVCSLLCCLTAFFEIILSSQLPKVPSHQPKEMEKEKEFTFDPFKNSFSVLKTAEQSGELKIIVAIYSFLYFSSGIFRINIMPYGMIEMGMRETESAFLLVFSGLGFIIGAILSGTLKTEKNHLRIIQIVMASIGPTFLLFYILRSTYTIFFLPGLFGLLTGMMFVSINSFVHLKADPRLIGKIIAATSFSGVLGSLLASGFILGFIDAPRDVFGFLSPFMVLFAFLFSKKLSQSIRC